LPIIINKLLIYHTGKIQLLTIIFIVMQKVIQNNLLTWRQFLTAGNVNRS